MKITAGKQKGPRRGPESSEDFTAREKFDGRRKNLLAKRYLGGTPAFDAVDEAPPRRTSLTTFAVSARLTWHPESLIRHCASVSVHPQSQDSAFIRFSATALCLEFNFEKSTPGSSVARSAFFKKTCPLSSKYS